jgi:hypothetical protein
MRVLFLFLWGCSSSPLATDTVVPDTFWAHWSDGQAELATYRLIQPQYGEPREGTAVLVFVTERLDPSTLIKTESDPSRGRAVFKLNDMRDFQTGVYDYHTMTSTFLALEGPSVPGVPLKVSTSVQEWCGHSWERLRFDARRIQRIVHSYFEGEGEQDTAWRYPAGAVVLDALPLTLRADRERILGQSGTRNVTWLTGRVEARLTHEQAPWRSGQLTLHDDRVERRVGDEVVTCEVWTLSSKETSITWWIEERMPHRLIGWQTSAGESAQLITTQRMAYWEAQGIADEPKRQALGL